MMKRFATRMQQALAPARKLSSYRRRRTDLEARTVQRQRKALVRDEKRNQHKRAEQRVDIFALAEIALPDRNFSLDGVIIDASPGGLSFRPSTQFIEDLTGEPVKLLIEGVAKNGVIRATRPNGYGVQLTRGFSTGELALLRDLSVDVEDERTAKAALLAE
ncbi:MAG: PilZ domain-containing protein [Pseudomonadota bacterium]